MHWSIVLTLLGFASLSAAHGPLPKLLGGRRLSSELRGKRLSAKQTSETRMAHVLDEIARIDKRADVDTREASGGKSGKCGEDRGTCAAGYCCSVEGWCGLGTDYCEAPDCQINYGPGCDANQKPTGVDTSSIARTRVGNVEYGGLGIYDCVNAGDIAITFDDGPWNYTSDLLDKLKSYGAKATFFITGNNIGKGQINDPSLPWKAVIQRMAAEGHQIASHTWSHQNFSELTTTQAEDQMIWNEIALNDILGYIPTYMRPPFSICEDECQSMLYDLGYHVIYFDLDTEGYLNDDPTLIQGSKDIWDEAITNSDACDDNFLQIEHDIHWQTVYNFTDYFVESLFSNGYRSVTVGECLGDPPENWYRAGSSAVPTYSFPVKSPTVSLDCGEASTAKRTSIGKAADSSTGSGSVPTGGPVVSEDGNCGNGTTCVGSQFGNCCSQYGWCGSTSDYCGQGCQPSWGSGCLSSSSTASTSLATSTISSTSATSSTTNTITTKTTSSTQSSTSSASSSPSSTSVTVSSSTDTRTTSSANSNTSTPSTSTSRSTSQSLSTSKSRSSTSQSNTSTTTTSSATPTILVPSKDGTCGEGTGYTCRGSSFGLCCNLQNQCALLCLLTGCQPDYGTCAVLIGPGGEEAVEP